MTPPLFRVLDIVAGTTVDGPGLRTSIYLAGCSHHCPGCHNPQSWSPQTGTVMSLDDILYKITEEGFDVTLTGGDPLFHPVETALLAKAIKSIGFGLWIYTGYTWEEICADSRLSTAVEYADVIVDGPFVFELADKDLLYRGSSNQRLLAIESRGGTLSVQEWENDLFYEI